MKPEFIWDPDKAAGNIRKHGISFPNAARVFLDPQHISGIESYVEGEERWRTIGRLDGETVVLIIHTTFDHDGGELIRIISARRADRKERRYYEESYGSL